MQIKLQGMQKRCLENSTWETMELFLLCFSVENLQKKLSDGSIKQWHVMIYLFISLPEQLWINKGDDVLQDLKCWANQKVGSKGSDDST